MRDAGARWVSVCVCLCVCVVGDGAVARQRKLRKSARCRCVVSASNRILIVDGHNRHGGPNFHLTRPQPRLRLRPPRSPARPHAPRGGRGGGGGPVACGRDHVFEAADAIVQHAYPGKRAVTFFGWVFQEIPLGGQAPHVLRAHMGVHRTCGGPNEIELTPIGLMLNRVGSVPLSSDTSWNLHPGEARSMHHICVNTPSFTPFFGIG